MIQPIRFEEKVDVIIVSVQDNDHLRLDTISKFAKSVKDVIHIEGDIL